MRYGLSMPNFGEFGDARTVADLATLAEGAGWDGFFLWDHIQFFTPAEPVPFVDPWIALTTVALTTSRIRFGPMVTPLPRRHPWKLARETVSLDRLSGGRLILGVGLGEPPETEYVQFGDDPDPRVRACKLDEGLAVLTALWRGEPVEFDGEVYHVHGARFWPPPVQTPRIPIWVAGWWPRKAPMRRAARWDGAFPAKLSERGEMLSPDEVREIAAFIAAERTSADPFDLVVSGETPGNEPAQAAATVSSYTDAGASWWIESIHGYRGSLAEMRERIGQGPPRVA